MRLLAILASLFLAACASHTPALAQSAVCPHSIGPNRQSGAGYTIQTSDHCGTSVFSNAGNINVHLPGAGLIFSPDFTTHMVVLNGGTLTLIADDDATGKHHTINGLGQITLAPNAGVTLTILQDGNWYGLPAINGTAPQVRADLGIGPIFSPTADHFADRTGVLDATAAFNASIADCNASAAGGVIDVVQGSFKITASTTQVKRNGCRFFFHGSTLLPTSGGLLTTIQFGGAAGSGVGTSFTLNSPALQDLNTFATDAVLAVGSFVFFERSTPLNLDVGLYRFVSRISAVSGGPHFTYTINDSFPVNFYPSAGQTGTTHTSKTITGLASTAGISVGTLVAAADIPASTIVTSVVSSTSVTISNAATGSNTESISFADNQLTAAPWTPIQNVGIDGQLTIDGSNHTGIAQSLEGITLNDCAFCLVRGVTLKNINPGIALRTNNGGGGRLGGGYGTLLDGIVVDNGSDASTAAMFLAGETLLKMSNVTMVGGVSSGFGVAIFSAAYPTVNNVTVTAHGQPGAGGRGFKIAGTVGGTFTGIVSNANAANGIAVTIGSIRNSFFGCVANDNAVLEGIWFSDDYDTNNKLFGCSAHGNSTRDIYFGVTDTNNQVFGYDFGVIRDDAVPPNGFLNAGANNVAWTPTDGSAGALTFTSVSAHWSQIQNLVYAYFTLTYPATADTNAAVIAGLPVAVPSGTVNATPAACFGTGGTRLPLLNPTPAASTASFTDGTNPSNGVLTNANLSGVRVNCMLIYPAS